jgi:hypothetical protein
VSAGGDVNSKAGRLALALRDAYHLFTRDQVAYLMATAARWGRESAMIDLAHAYELGRQAGLRHVAELNLAAIRAGIDARPFSAAETIRGIEQKQRRQAADAGARVAREGDFPGWGSDPAAYEPRSAGLLATWDCEAQT